MVGFILVAVASGWGGGCPADGLFVDEPEGWSLERDGPNGCVWTLFNEEGERAPEQLYDSLPIESPGSIPL
jgi:hypothetical protein